MAVSLLEEPLCRFEKATIISNSGLLPVASKVTEQAVADDLKESNECKHFTIRGYVSEVRKRDAKKCFPFLHHSSAMLEPSNVFPPLPASKFRRWGCPNCVYEIIATGQMHIGGATSIHNKDVSSNNYLMLGKDVEASQLHARKALSRLPQNLSENHLKEMLEVKDCSVKISRPRMEGNERLQRDLIKEGCQKYKDGQGQVKDAIESNCLSYRRNAVNKGRVKYRNSVGRKKLGVAYVKDSLTTALVKHKRSRLQKVGHSKMLDGDATSIRINFRLCCSKEDQGTERKREEKITCSNVRQGHTTIDMVVEKDDVQDADPAHTFSLGACCNDKQTCGVSVDCSKYIGLTDGEHQIQNEAENMHIKKIRKFRLLEDIIRSEKQSASGDRHMLAGRAKTIHHALSRSQATSKEKVLLLDHICEDARLNNALKNDRGKSEFQNSLGEEKVQEYEVTYVEEKKYCILQRNQLKSVKRKKRHENHSEDAGPFLMQCVNNRPKKANACEGEANMKHINCNFFPPKFSANLIDRKDQDLDVRDSDINLSNKKSTFKRKQNVGLKDDQVTSRVVIHEEMKSNIFSSQDFCTNKAVDSEKTRGTKDGTGDIVLHSILNKRPLRDQVSSAQNKATLKVWEKVSKKPRTNRITDQETVDDIPMNIVELLARNQHERFLLKADTDTENKLKFPAKTESIKCILDLDSSQKSRNNVADAEKGNILCQKFQAKNKGFDVWTKFPCNNEMEYEPKYCSCSINGKKKLQIDLNQHHSVSLIGGDGFCKDINMNCHQLNISCCRRNNMHFFNSSVEDHTTGCESRNPYQNVLQHRNGASFGCKSQFLNNSNASVLGSNLELFALSGDSGKPRNLVGKHHYWGSFPAPPNDSPFVDLANGCHSNFGPVDLYSNKTISALNLLRLMDQAAWSGESQPHFQIYSGSKKETDLFVNGQYNESQFGYGNREIRTCICPVEVNPTARQQPRNSCLLFRPLPRIGSLGPSLQNEIFNYSSYSSIPTSNSHGFLKVDAKEKIEPSYLNSNTFVCNSHNSLFRCKCFEKNCPDRDPDRCSTSKTSCSVANGGAARAELNNKVDALLPLGSFCKMEICVVNRNPAEFTVIDENNEYMIEIKELKLKSLSRSFHVPLHGQKKQRIMKLNDLKAFAM